MNKYTVLLLRPDYMADEFGKDTYLAHVMADGAEQAQVLAQVAAWIANNEDNDDADPADQLDYHVLFVALGHHENLSL